MDEFWFPKVGQMVRTRESYSYVGPAEVGVVVKTDARSWWSMVPRRWAGSTCTS